MSLPGTVKLQLSKLIRVTNCGKIQPALPMKNSDLSRFKENKPGPAQVGATSKAQK